MKTRNIVAFFFVTIWLNIFLYSCKGKETGKKQKIVQPGSLQFYRSLFESNGLNSKNFYTTLEQYERLITDSLISAAKEIRDAAPPNLSRNAIIKYCPISGKIQGTENGILIQTGTNANGKVEKFSFGISGYRGEITQTGQIEQQPQQQGVNVVRIYLKGAFHISDSRSSDRLSVIGIHANSLYSKTL